VIDWAEIDRRLAVAAPFILTDEERQRVRRVEQAAFDANLPQIRAFLEAHAAELQRRDFWTELQAEPTGLRFRYSYPGFYGPGGFASQFHVAGPLVLGRIEPKGDPIASFYPNDLDENVFIGERFDEIAFADFVRDDLLRYLAPENQILSLEQYEWIREMLASSGTT
jgi:hypothetical protein